MLDDGQVEEGADAPSIALWSASTGGSNAMKRLYLFAIAMARRSIDIASPYFITDESSMWGFEDAISRRSRRLDFEEWQRRPSLEKARERFWSYFGECSERSSFVCLNVLQ